MTVLGISTAIAYIALDTRLGCLDANLAPHSEPQKMIDSVQVQFETLNKLDFGIRLWKYVSTPTWRKFVKAADVFLECV
jgi:cytochrome P450 family 49 subfamily A